MRRLRRERIALALALAAVGVPVAAARPLGTDDATTAAAGTCQVRGWTDRGGDRYQAPTVAPACGLVAGLEIGSDHTRAHARDAFAPVAGLALKWVPAQGHHGTPLGGLDLGLKLSTGFEDAAGAGWRRRETTAIAIASLAPGAGWNLHANLGGARDRSSGSNAGLLNVAVTWTPRERTLLFAEVLANDRRDVFGGAVRSAGARAWLVKDRVDLDLSASAQAGSDEPARWSVGIGWHGPGF